MRRSVNGELNLTWKPCPEEDEMQDQSFCTSQRTIWFDHQVFYRHPVLSTEALSCLHHEILGSAIGERRSAIDNQDHQSATGNACLMPTGLTCK
jgi:hypothetical protein